MYSVCFSVGLGTYWLSMIYVYIYIYIWSYVYSVMVAIPIVQLSTKLLASEHNSFVGASVEFS